MVLFYKIDGMLASVLKMWTITWVGFLHTKEQGKDF